jgi:hypothetical protein
MLMPGDDVGFYPVVPGEPPSFKEKWLDISEDRCDYVSESLSLLKPEKSEDILLVGFVSLASQVCRIHLLTSSKSKEVVFTASSCLEGFELEPGNARTSEILQVELGRDTNALLESWTDAVTKMAKIKPRILKRVPGAGWLSWQYYREEATEKDILENLEHLAQMKQEGYPFEYVYVGGACSEPLASEWLETSESFPHGAEWLSERIRAKGLKVAVWLAPFITNIETRVAREHPEWMVMDSETRKPLLVPMSNVGPAYLLDYTVPEALRWLKRVVRERIRMWRCEWMPLDQPGYLLTSLGQKGGRLHNPNITSIEMIRKALEAIREEAGDILIEGQGHYGTAIGISDLHRVQHDIQPYWADPDSTPHGKKNWANDLMSNFLHDRFWINHREGVIFRDFPSPFYWRKKGNIQTFAREGGNPALVEPMFTDNELRFHITVAFLCGGPVILEDRLKYLLANPERRRLISKIVPPFGKAAKMADAFSGKREAEVFVLDVDALGEEYKIVGLFNFADEYRDFRIPFEQLGLDSSAYHTFEYWGERYQLCKNILREDNLPPHSCRLLSIRSPKSHPQLLSTSLHLSQGAVDLKSVSYVEDKKCLKIVCNHFIQENEKIFVHVPEGFALKELSTNAVSYLVDNRTRNILIIHFSGKGETKFDILFIEKQN